jgi:hypothetical protein
MIIEALVALALSGPDPAAAAAPAAASPAAAPPAAASPAERAPSAVIGDEALKLARGGETVVVNNQTLSALLSGNVIGGDYTAGSVTISDQALSNFNGLGNLLINTGAQNALQAGMTLTINVNP